MANGQRGICGDDLTCGQTYPACDGDDYAVGYVPYDRPSYPGRERDVAQSYEPMCITYTCQPIYEEEEECDNPYTIADGQKTCDCCGADYPMPSLDPAIHPTAVTDVYPPPSVYVPPIYLRGRRNLQTKYAISEDMAVTHNDYI
eukprot:UN28001